MKFLTFVLILLFSVPLPAFGQKINWPKIKDTKEYKTIVQNALQDFRDQKLDPSKHFIVYKPEGSYMRYGFVWNFRESERVKFDKNGIPMLKFGQNFYYHPVQLMQFAFINYDKALGGDSAGRNLFLSLADFLIEMQDHDGAIRYGFEWRYYLTKEVYKPGWISGMAQGQALSVFTRAFLMTNKYRYFLAANKAFSFLITPKEKGGPMSTLADLDPSLKEFIFFEEYISTPNNYTLNGYLFTLIGLYDFQQMFKKIGQSSSYVDYYFNKGIETLVKLLPYYDLDGFTSYDLGHYVLDKLPHIGVSYHSVHIYLLNAIYSFSSDNQILFFKNKWMEYVN